MQLSPTTSPRIVPSLPSGKSRMSPAIAKTTMKDAKRMKAHQVTAVSGDIASHLPPDEGFWSFPRSFPYSCHQEKRVNILLTRADLFFVFRTRKQLRAVSMLQPQQTSSSSPRWTLVFVFWTRKQLRAVSMLQLQQMSSSLPRWTDVSLDTSHEFRVSLPTLSMCWNWDIERKAGAEKTKHSLPWRNDYDTQKRKLKGQGKHPLSL